VITGKEAVAVLCSWESNQRFGVHQMCITDCSVSISILRLRGLRKGDKHPADTSVATILYVFTFTLL